MSEVRKNSGRIEDEMKIYVRETPDFVRKMGMGKKKSVAFNKIADSLLKMKPTECLVFTVQQLDDLVGGLGNIKNSIAGLRNGLKTRGIKRAKIVMDSDRIYITRSEV